MVYTSNSSIRIPVKIGKEVRLIRVSQVNANVPLLIGRDVLTKWNCRMDFKNKVLSVDSKFKVNLDLNKKGHYVIDMMDAKVEAIKVVESFFTEKKEEEMKHLNSK